ncbi:hypothetical protein F7725_009598, partial [Dissostichus mawsoni]
MSLFGLPRTRMFWNKACRVSQVADTMTLNRWEAIKKYLHFSNNEDRQEEDNDPLHKIRPSGKSLECKRGRPSLTIAGEYEEKRRKGPATPIPIPDVRLDATAHWMVMDEKKGRCKVPGCTGTPKPSARN